MNPLVSGNIKEKVKWYIKAHGHSSIGGLNLIWTYFSYHYKNETAQVIDKAIKLFENFAASGNLEEEILELKESTAVIRTTIQHEDLEDEKKTEMLEILNGVDKNIMMISQIIDNPGYMEEFCLSKILFSAVGQLLAQHPGVLFGDMIGPKKDGTRIKLNFKEPENERNVRCCGYEIGLVFYNLLANAVDAIPTEGNISVEITYEKDKVILSVADDGALISDEDIEKVINHKEFSTKGRGHGHGLLIVDDIIEKYKGTLTIKTDPDAHLVTFIVRLPF